MAVVLENDIPVSPLNLFPSQKLSPIAASSGSQHGDGCVDFDKAEAPDPTMQNVGITGFLMSLGMEHLTETFEKEQVMMPQML